MPSIIWDVNLTTVTIFVSGCLTFYLGVLRTQDRVRQTATQVTEVRKAIDEWKMAQLALRAEHEILKQELHQDYLPRKEFDSTVDKLFDKIDEGRREQMAAINRLDDRLLEYLGGKQQTPRRP